jgi:hypothetical protein
MLQNYFEEVAIVRAGEEELSRRKEELSRRNEELLRRKEELLKTSWKIAALAADAELEEESLDSHQCCSCAQHTSAHPNNTLLYGTTGGPTSRFSTNLSNAIKYQLAFRGYGGNGQ